VLFGPRRCCSDYVGVAGGRVGVTRTASVLLGQRRCYSGRLQVLLGLRKCYLDRVNVIRTV
jgi:hypothetical protein